MKIAILTSEYITEPNWHGGLANYLSRIVEGLNKRGHKIHIFVYSNRYEVFEKDGVIIHRIGFNEKYFHYFNIVTLRLFSGIFVMLTIAYKFRKYFLNVAKKEKFDIIHSASCQTPALFMNSKKIGIPIVTRLSSVMKLCQIAYNRKNYIDMYLVNQAEKSLIKNSDKTFAPSNLVKAKVKKEFNIDIDVLESPEYFREITNLDYSVYENYLNDKKYILFYGTLGRLKGSEFIADIIYDLLSKYKDYYFVIVGKMEILSKRRLPIESIIENAKEYRNRIIYMNSLEHSRLLPIIKNSKAVFLPSMIDNLPNTCIESMSIGKIVIGTYDGGFDQLIKNRENGFIVDYGDKNKVRDIFDFICKSNNHELNIMEEKAKRTIHERLSFDEKLIELENYYKNAINDFNK